MSKVERGCFFGLKARIGHRDCCRSHYHGGVVYAPKLRTWITPAERSMMAVQSRIDRMADNALAEIREMTRKASVVFDAPPAERNAVGLLGLHQWDPSDLDFLSGLLSRPLGGSLAQQQGEAMRNVYPAGAYRSGAFGMRSAGIGGILCWP
jgi:hypothetical protein